MSILTPEGQPPIYVSHLISSLRLPVRGKFPLLADKDSFSACLGESLTSYCTQCDSTMFSDSLRCYINVDVMIRKFW
jgi:hypothetical protein